MSNYGKMFRTSLLAKAAANEYKNRHHEEFLMGIAIAIVGAVLGVIGIIVQTS